MSGTQAVGSGQMKPDERLVQLTHREVELLLRYAERRTP
jgi:hypothetical protein